MALKPENRIEQILAGENITPENRTEAFTKEAIDNAGGGGGGSVTVDSALSGTSENPVQNKAIYARLAELEAAIEAANNDYKVTFTLDTGSGTVTADKTIAEINTAAAAGKHVFAEVTVTLGDVSVAQRFELCEYAERAATFYAVQIDQNEGDPVPKPVCIYGVYDIQVPDEDTWTVVDA